MNSYKRPENVKQFNQEDKQPNLYNIDHIILSDKQSLTHLSLYSKRSLCDPI